MRRCPMEQAAPAAADVEEPFALPEAELAANMVELGLLRRVEVFLPGREVAAGIDHVAVEPEPVERVRDVVMVADRRGITALRVAPRHIAQQRPEPGDEPR